MRDLMMEAAALLVLPVLALAFCVFFMASVWIVAIAPAPTEAEATVEPQP